MVRLTDRLNMTKMFTVDVNQQHNNNCPSTKTFCRTYAITSLPQRGAVAEWLERLGYGAESRPKVLVRSD